MLEKRLRILLGGFGLAAVVLIARLAQLQVFSFDYYQAQAEQAVILAPSSLPFVRGSISDRFGETLVADRACWDLKIDYAALAAEFSPGKQPPIGLIRRLKRERRYPQLHTNLEVAEAFRAEMRIMWGDLTWFAAAAKLDAGRDVHAIAEEVHAKIGRIRAAVAKRRGFDAPVAEEGQSHTLIAGLSAEQQIRGREIFDKYSWVCIEPSANRVAWGDATAFAHILGRLARVGPERLADDPNRDNPFAAYQSDDVVGSSGVEWLAERRLRGRRGQVIRDRDGQTVEQIDAENGADVRLTLHGPLQRRLYDVLGDAVLADPDSSGGVIVVLDIPSREVLAMVSYPSFDPNTFEEAYEELRDDTDRLPLLFRAVTTRYAPGSTIKPLTCLAGLSANVISLDSRENCTGYLFEDFRDGWRCWEVHGTGIRKAHGNIDVVEALIGSCNIFMYRLGERLGIDRLCGAFDMAGVGRSTGIGLREENSGINPTPSWLMSSQGKTVSPGLPRLYAMGQGEIAMTPLQVANLMATYANGRWRPVTLVGDASCTPEWKLPGTADQWRAIRTGIYGVTNDADGTAFKYAHFEQDGYVLSGKTGSATVKPWPTEYRIPYRDGNGHSQAAIVREGGKGPAIERFRAENPGAVFDPEMVEVARRWPPHPPRDGGEHAHAWFAGYLQRTTAEGRPDWSYEPRVAFAVLVEFGGSGGQVSGPVAKQVAGELLRILGPDLDAGRAAEVAQR